MNTPYKVLYKNWKGVVSERSVLIREILYGATEYHTEPQWLAKGFDLDKKKNRTFALCDMKLL